jgi:hypothetical protein
MAQESPFTESSPLRVVLPALPAGPAHRTAVDKRFTFAVLALAVATVATRIPFRSRYLFAWDSANFALALDQYNVAFHQPQPPGYPLYVASAWLVRAAFGTDANASYVALSIVASAIAVAILTIVGARLFDRTIGLLAGVILATSALFWGQGEVAYPYAFLAAFGSIGAWVALRIADGGHGTARWAVGGAIILVIGSGFRSEVAPFLAPLWAWGMLTWHAPWRHRAITVAASGVAGLVAGLSWYVPMVALTGGWDAYATATGGYYAYFIQATSGAGKQLLGVLENLRALVNFAYAGLGPGTVIVAFDLGVRFRPTRIVADRSSRVLALWMAPPVAFYLLVHLGNPGYVLTLVPALALVVAAGARDLVADAVAAISRVMRVPEPATHVISRVTVAAVGGIAIINSLLFLVGPGEGRRRQIASIDAHFARVLGAIRSDYPPTASMVVAYDRSRQYRYELPRWRHELLFDVAVAGVVTDVNRYWEWRRRYVVPEGISWIVFPDLGENRAEAMGLVIPRDLGGGEVIWVAAVRAGDEVTWGYGYAAARRP